MVDSFLKQKLILFPYYNITKYVNNLPRLDKLIWASDKLISNDL